MHSGGASSEESDGGGYSSGETEWVRGK
jgi:hypothetical protein